MSTLAIDPELLDDFIAESIELLDAYAVRAMELERKPADQEVIGAIFRAAHTLKGSSAFFNLVHIKNFAHRIENLLDDIRKLKRPVTPEAVDYLLKGAKFLKGMFNRLSAGDMSTEPTLEENDYLLQLKRFIENPEIGPTDPEAVLKAICDRMDAYRRNGSACDDTLGDIMRLLAGFRKTSAPDAEPAGMSPGRACGVDPAIWVDRLRRIMDPARASGQLDAAALDETFLELESLAGSNGLSGLKAPLAEASEDFRAVRDSGIDFDAILIGLIDAKIQKVIDYLNRAAPTDSTRAEPPAQTPLPVREDRIEKKTMRIDEAKVDGFMSYVGELIVTAETFGYLQKMIEKERINPQTVRAFKNANQAFRELSDQLQASLMEIRKVPIRGLIQKIRMMVRELSGQMKKTVKVIIEGEDIQVDKSIAESLEGPLVHLVRNSLDHGLEKSEDREAAGKSPEGSLSIRAAADKEYFYLEVGDDGRGVDPRIIRGAALEKGVITAAQAQSMTDKEAVNLIFKAGFSTARQITDVSGRGVGMDVVRQNIQQLNGVINVESQVGRGSVISMKIPLSITLQVIKALLVRCGAQFYTISLDEIVESLRPAPGDITTVKGRGETFTRRGRILPLLRLYEVLDIPPEWTDPTKAILVVVETSKGRFGIMVDEVVGQQQVVVKDLEGQFKKLAFLSGSAALGDGRLGLVLDTDGLVQLALSKSRPWAQGVT